MTEQINLVILAAGKGTRLGIETPKPLVTAAGRSLVDYVVRELDRFTREQALACEYHFIIGHEKEKVETHLKNNFQNLKLNFTWQKEQLGTGHALQCFFNENPSASKAQYTIVVCADTPLIKKETFNELFKQLKHEQVEAVAASFEAKNPYGYGRIERKKLGFNIVEQKDASEAQAKITEVNSGIYIFKTQYIEKHIHQLDSKNQSKEFYLTDLFKGDDKVMAILFPEEEQFLGVNDLNQLEKAENYIMDEKLKELQTNGVKLIRSQTMYIEESVKVGRGSCLHPAVALYGNTVIGENVEIEPGVVIKDSQIADGVIIKANCYLEQCEVGEGSTIGPMARLREASIVGENCKIGNFVETKKVHLAKGVKISHLSYVGDAEVGKNTNIGCGFITCNYDGAQKHKSIIGEDTFIGSDCQLIAPIKIGSEVFIGSGSTINQDVPDKAFAIARQRQVTKENMSHKFIKKKD